MKYYNCKRYLKALWVALLLFLAMPGVKAQVTVEATIDSLQLLIGEQAKIKLQVSMDANQKLRFRCCVIHWLREWKYWMSQSLIPSC